MNRRFAIIISITTAILIALLIALSIFRSGSQPSEQVSEQVTVPTGVPSVDRGSNVPTISKQNMDGLNMIQGKLPFDSDSLAIDYSALTNKVYIEKKNEDADAEFQKFLEDNQLLDLYEQNPNLFVTTNSGLASFINEDEQKVDFAPEDDVAPTTERSTPALTYSQQRNQNQYEAFNQLTRSIFSFDKLLLKPTPQKPISIRPLLPGVQEETAPAQLVYGGNTSNIPCAAGTDYGVTDGYANGVLTKIRACRVKGFVVNSQISKQLNDLLAAANTAGIVFGGGSLRTMAGQIAIYQSWCRRDGIVGSPPPYPKAPGETIKCPGGGAPGYSNHQMGLAIDFNCDGALLPKKYVDAVNNRCFRWLQANAGKYGLFEVGMGKESSRAGPGYEGWHWSVNGN